MTESELVAVAAEVTQCRRCPRLVAWRTEVAITKRASYSDQTYWGRGVPAFGSADASVLVVGLAPAAHGANRTGRMFTGDRSGDWLYAAMYRAGFANQPTSTDIDDGLALHDALVTSAVKCAPPQNKPTPAERDACAPYLAREIAAIKPKVFLVLGGFAYGALCGHLGVKPRPKFGHGVEVPLDDGANNPLQLSRVPTKYLHWPAHRGDA